MDSLDLKDLLEYHLDGRSSHAHGPGSGPTDLQELERALYLGVVPVQGEHPYPCVVPYDKDGSNLITHEIGYELDELVGLEDYEDPPVVDFWALDVLGRSKIDEQLSIYLGYLSVIIAEKVFLDLDEIAAFAYPRLSIPYAKDGLKAHIPLVDVFGKGELEVSVLLPSRHFLNDLSFFASAICRRRCPLAGCLSLMAALRAFAKLIVPLLFTA